LKLESELDGNAKPDTWEFRVAATQTVLIHSLVSVEEDAYATCNIWLRHAYTYV
jgi:hypothetical protein